MFDALTDRLSSVFDRLSGRGVLSEKDVAEVMREIRVALLEADVALPVVRDFIAKATEAATGEAVIRSVRPADQVVKITYDGLVDMLGGTGEAEQYEQSGRNAEHRRPSSTIRADAEIIDSAARARASFQRATPRCTAESLTGSAARRRSA